MGKQVDLEEMIAETEMIQIPAYFFYEDISLSAVGLACSIQSKEGEIKQIAKDKGISFDKAVIALYSNAFRYEFRSAMNELIATKIYEFEDEEGTK